MQTATPTLRLDGKRLAIVRQLKGITQTELAKGLGSTQPHISRLEHGEGGASLKMIHRLADELGCAVGDIASFHVNVSVPVAS